MSCFHIPCDLSVIVETLQQMAVKLVADSRLSVNLFSYI